MSLTQKVVYRFSRKVKENHPRMLINHPTENEVNHTYGLGGDSEHTYRQTDRQTDRQTHRGVTGINNIDIKSPYKSELNQCPIRLARCDALDCH